jgi:superfamily II DNA helicase RecQ
MQLRFFTIPVHDGGERADELNRFLAGHRILAVDRSFVQDGANSAWSLCVSFDAADAAAGRPPFGGRRGPKTDYREVLSEQDFAVFARLRALRKELAEAEGVPAYALFTNEQLAEMVQRQVRTRAALLEIPGVGEARVEKYAERFLEALGKPAALPAPLGEGEA